MANLAVLKKATDAITVMNVAVTNIRLYPPSSAIIRNTVDRVHQLLTQILAQESSVILAESGNNFVVCGHVFDESDQRRHPQAAALLDLISRFGIRSVSFEQGLTKTELKTFLQIFSRNPSDVETEGGLQEVVRQKNLPHILMDHKVYVVVDKDQKIVAGVGVRDEDIVKYLTGFGEVTQADLARIREMAKDPKWVTQVFQAGMAYLMKEKGETSFRKLSEVIGHMIRTLDEISDEEHRERIIGELASAIVEMEDETMALVLAQEATGPFGEALFDRVIEVLDDEQFERIAARIQQMGDDADDPATQAYRYLMESGKGQRLRDRVRRRQTEERKKRERKVALLKDGLTRIVRGDTSPFLEAEFTAALPDYTKQLVAGGRGSTIRTLLGKLGAGLADERPEVRENAAAALVAVGRPILADGRIVPLAETSPTWLGWLQEEPEVSEAYVGLCRLLQDLAREMIRAEVFEESTPILETFHRLRYRNVHPAPEVRETAGDVLREIATNDVLDLLLEEFQSGSEDHRRQTIHLLGLFGEASVDRLLDLLEESRDMSIRVRILQVLSEIGTPAPAALVRRIEKGGPWYYLRNLILMLGKVGREEDLKVLVPLLRHEDFRVRRETLNSIYNIGGDRRGDILVNALREADDRLRLTLVDMLGALGHRPATRPLMEMLEGGKSFFSTKISDRLQEKICTALGRIGSDEAVPMLSNIAGQKGLLGLRSMPDNVREAAAHALANIGRAETANGGGETHAKLTLPGRKLTLPGTGPKKPSAPEVLPTDLTLPAAMGERIVKRNDDTVEENVVDMLMGAIREAARVGDFDRAEALRQQLVELDGLALTEIIRAGEIIEEERTSDHVEVEEDHLDIWPELYDSLTPEESEALYEALAEKDFQADETVFQQGDPGNRLFFVQGGTFKLVFLSGERETLIKTAGKGDIVGEDTFFGISVCTTSLVALSRSWVSFLDRKVLESWRETYPALESKLHDYCLRLERIQDIIETKGLERRKQERFSVSGVVDVQLLNPSGDPTGKKFKGNLRDISVGGISFGIRSPSRKNVSLLLGRSLEMLLDFPSALGPALGVEMMMSQGSPKIRIKHVGTVIGVSHMNGDDYAVHIQFETLLSGDDPDAGDDAASASS